MKLFKTLILLFFISSSVFSQDPELKLTVTSVSYGGKYANRHCIAAWIKTKDGKYVNSFLVYAKSRITHLTDWKANSGSIKGDAITGATINPHRTHNVTIKARDYQGKALAKGDYILCFQMTEANNAGKTYYYNFSIGDNSFDLFPAGSANFKSIKLSYTAPATTPVEDHSADNNMLTIFPNPAQNQFTINVNLPDKEHLTFELFDMNKRLVQKTDYGMRNAGSNVFILNTSECHLNKGIYLAKISTGKGSVSKQLIIE